MNILFSSQFENFFTGRLNSTDDLDDDNGSIYASHQGKVFTLDEDDYSD